MIDKAHRVRGSLGISVLLVAALTACPSVGWHRPGATESDLAKAKKACTVESGNLSGVSNLYTSRYVAACLKERGWREGPPPASSPAPIPAPISAPVPATPAVSPPPPVPAPAATAPPASAPAAATASESDEGGLTFDQCFDRCRSLTDRTKEQCFDTCLRR